LGPDVLHSSISIPSDPYETLQVSPHASSDVIRAAYRVLARNYHPDVSTSPTAALRMQELNAAYHALIDPARRAQFDAQLHIGRAHMAASRRLSPPPRRKAVLDPSSAPGIRRARPLVLALMLGLLLLLAMALVLGVSLALDALDAPVSAEHIQQAAAVLGLV
jgi:hypothetical protein